MRKTGIRAKRRNDRRERIPMYRDSDRLLIKPVTTGIRRNKLRFSSRVFSAIQGSNYVNGTVRFAIRFVFEKRAGIRQLTTCPTVDTLTFTSFGDGQYRGESPFYSGRPGISFFVSHNPIRK